MLAWVAPNIVLVVWAVVGTGLALLAARRLPWAGRWKMLFWRFGGSGGRIGAAAALVGAVLVSLVDLVAVWESGRALTGLIGGIIPLSDGQLYTGGAARLLYFGDLDVYNSQRPFTAMFDAVWLALTGFDLRLALVLQAVLVGVACYVAVGAVARDLGRLAGLALFAGVFAFAQLSLATTMSEPPGLILGLLAFATLWNAIRTRSRVVAVAGIFFQAFALSVRAGALPVVLLLCFWFAHYLRRSGLLDWRVLGACLGAVMIAVGLSYGTVAALGGSVDNLNGNASYLFYGMARGHPGWERDNTKVASWAVVLEEHPGLYRLPYVERNVAIRDLARDEIVAHPFRFLLTALESGKNYLESAGDRVVAAVPAGQRRLAWLGAGLLAVAVLVRRWRRSGRRARLDVALFGGVILSMPALYGAWLSLGGRSATWFGAALAVPGFIGLLVIGTDRLTCRAHLSCALAALAGVAVSIPLIGADSVRVLAPVMAFVALPSAFAVAAVRRALVGDVPAPGLAPVPSRPTTLDRSPLLIGGALLAVVLVGTPVAMAAVGEPGAPARTCPDGLPAEALFGGVKLSLVDGSVTPDDAIDRLPREALQPAYLLALLPLVNQATIEPTTIVAGVTAAGADRLAFLRGEVGRVGRAPLYLCGQTVHDAYSDAVYKVYPQPLDFFAGTTIP